ncbi:twin-arginine translocase TatA/TatE family subunit [bacterium]|nr:twin-arginine translocase TatA/TatE family subunit [bacterium]MCP5462675.1 twin-arginine translocase TatA/TatE family subunit [bacterium]
MVHTVFAFLGGIGFPELLVILIVALLLFGAKKLPEIARSLGLGIKEFKKSLKDIPDDDNSDNQRENT